MRLFASIRSVCTTGSITEAIETKITVSICQVKNFTQVWVFWSRACQTCLNNIIGH